MACRIYQYLTDALSCQHTQLKQGPLVETQLATMKQEADHRPEYESDNYFKDEHKSEDEHSVAARDSDQPSYSDKAPSDGVLSDSNNPMVDDDYMNARVEARGKKNREPSEWIKVDRDEFDSAQLVAFRHKVEQMLTVMNDVYHRYDFFSRFHPHNLPDSATTARVRMTADEQACYYDFTKTFAHAIAEQTAKTRDLERRAKIREIWRNRAKKGRTAKTDAVSEEGIIRLAYMFCYAPPEKSQHHTPATKALVKNSNAFRNKTMIDKA
jgi:hypothetical protein